MGSVKEVVVGGQGVARHRYLLCHNPREAERQRKHREKVVQILEAELAKHKDKSATAQWAIDLLASHALNATLLSPPKDRLASTRRPSGKLHALMQVGTADQ